MPTDLLSYQGNANLGSGSNPQIPVTSTKGLDIINQAADRLTQKNSAINLIAYNQKLKEKDQLLQALDSGDIKTGVILDQDRPMVKSALDELDKAYFERIKKGVNDLDAADAYKKKLRAATDAVTQAQARNVFATSENAAISKETLPSKQGARRKNLEGSLGSFWSDLKPYVPAVDFNHPQMNQSVLRDALIANSGVSSKGTETTQTETITDKDGKKVVVKSTKTTPVKAGATKGAPGVGGANNGQPSIFNTVPGKFYDYEKIAANAADDYLHDEQQRINQAMWLKSVQEDNPAEAKRVIDYTNQRIDQYNKERGLAPTDAGYVTPIDVVVDPQTKQIHFDQTPSEFAAKTALASIPGNFVEQDQTVFNKDAADYNERLRSNKAKEAIDWYEAKTGRINANRLSKAAQVNEQVANSALYYAKGLFDKLNLLKDEKTGIISGENLKKLTTDELNYLGQGKTEENKFTLTPLPLEGKVIKVNDDGSIQVGTGSGKKSIWSTSTKDFEPEVTIQQKTVALNKLGDEMLQTTGKEGYNFNTLTPLYDAIEVQKVPEKNKKPDVKYPSNVEAGIDFIMKKNNISREQAVSALREAGKIK